MRRRISGHDLATSSWSGDASEQAKHSSQRRVRPKAVKECAYGCVRMCRSEKLSTEDESLRSTADSIMFADFARKSIAVCVSR